MTNSAQQLIYQAALLLDEGEDIAGAEAALREALSLSEIAGRSVERIQAATFLGELFLQTEREDQARELFQTVIVLAQHFDGDPGSIEAEVDAARQYLERL